MISGWTLTSRWPVGYQGVGPLLSGVGWACGLSSDLGRLAETGLAQLLILRAGRGCAFLFRDGSPLSTFVSGFQQLNTRIDLVGSILVAQGDSRSPGGFATMLPALALIMVLFYLMLIRPERNKQKAHQALLDSLKKNDRIITVGGIYGVVTNVQRDVDEVTIKVDESTNTKLRITMGSVARVIRDEADSDKPKS
jgi:preprotein translocase subunit YajC